VKGCIVSRNVDKGQTVAASFQAPLIFVIANDLRKMEIQVNVPEADVGRILVGQNVPFTVDAYPDHIFDGKVSQVRLQSTTVNNVVTYTVMVDLENPADKHHPDGMLLPGMTANVTFEIAKSGKDSLHVMTTALRFDPSAELIEREEKPPRDAKTDAKSDHGKRRGDSRRGRIFIKSAQGLLHAIPVKTGVSDGVQVEVTPLDPSVTLEEGTEVVIGIQPPEEEEATNPFAMRMGGGRR
jgi:HlyD family secretion protein